jgi:hypothetical protein
MWLSSTNFIRELQLQGVLLAHHIDTLLNPADDGTKVLDRRKLKPVGDMMMDLAMLVQATKMILTCVSDNFA